MSDASLAPARRRLAIELAGLALLAAVYTWAFPDRPRVLDLALACVALVAIALDAPRSRRIWAAVPGAAAAGARPYREMLALTGLAAVALGAVGAALAPEEILERLSNWHLLAAVLLYLPWAWLQQLLFQFYLLGRLLSLLPVGIAVALTALAFSAVHFPRYPVMAVTVVAGAAWAWSYRRHRRLAPVALSHAVLGPVLHYWVLGRDLLADWLP